MVSFYLTQIKDVADAGLTVSFLQENSFPVLPAKVVVLELPKAKTKCRSFGLEFLGGLQQELIIYFTNNNV